MDLVAWIFIFSPTITRTAAKPLSPAFVAEVEKLGLRGCEARVSAAVGTRLSRRLFSRHGHLREDKEDNIANVLGSRGNGGGSATKLFVALVENGVLFSSSESGGRRVAIS
jgi:hypothetical protein